MSKQIIINKDFVLMLCKAKQKKVNFYFIFNVSHKMMKRI
jgi:hypothetical protein